MSKTIDLLTEARSVLAEIMEMEGEFTEGHEEWLQHYLNDCEEQTDWLGHLYRRCKAESAFIDDQIRRLMAAKKKSTRTASWARKAMLDFLLVRQQLGEPTNIKGVAHLMKKQSLRAPESPHDWPVRFLIEQPPKLDTAGVRKALNAREELPEGFSLVDSYSVVMK